MIVNQFQDGDYKLTPNRDIIQDCVGDVSDVKVKIKIDSKEQHTLCKTCQSHMKRNRMPPMCQKSKLSISHEPKLERLTRLKNSLIARELNFMFIRELPVSRMWCQQGKVTLVPIKEEAVRATVHTSPREDSTSKVVYCQFLFRNP